MIIILLLISVIIGASTGYYLNRRKIAHQSLRYLKTPLFVGLTIAVVALIGLRLTTNNQSSHQSQATKQSNVAKVKKLSTKEKKAVLATSSSLKKELTQKQQEAKKLNKKLAKKQKVYKKQVKVASESTSIVQAKAISESQAAASSLAQSQSIAAAQQSQEQTKNTVYVAPGSGQKYHNDPNCRGLSQANSVVPMSLADAQAQGYTLCGWED